ncbi:MAG: InlB B-repeat-containing protein, partial [Clostridia bacterium]|nr:InlB B-repeat-containing protein [Clostridia bacterium]
KILRLYAYREGVNVAKSDTFTVNFTPAEFTKQPQGITITNGSTYTFTWDTSFNARFRILYWDTEYNDWSNGGETTGHSFSVTKNTTQAITYKVVADIPYTMANGATNYVWDVATSQSFIVSWVEDVPEATGITATYTGTILAGTTINPSGISITLNYSDSSTEPVNAGNVEYWYNGSQIQDPINYVFGVELIGNLNITVKYQGFETIMAVQVVGYEITFNANNGTGDMQPVEYVGEYTLPNCTFTAPNGKQFKGWSTSANGEVIDGATYNVTANVELFAIWEDIPVVKYNVTFNANGGTGTMSPVEYAGTYTLPTCAFTAPDGKKFKGWATTANGEVINGTTYNVTADVELFAIWEDIPVVNFDVTFNANGGTGTMSPVEYAGIYTLPTCTFTAPDGKQFKGWSTSANGEVIDGATYNVTANVELFAIWEDIPHNHDHGTTWESDANNHWNECSCGDKTNVGTHADSDNNGKCDTCDYQMGNGGAPETPDEPKDGLSGGAIAGIVVGSVVVLGLGGFALVWFVIKKKSFADLVAIFKKK